MIGIQSVVANISGGDPKNRYSGRGGDFPFEAVEMRVDALRLPAGIGEDRVIDLGEDAFGGKGEESAGLNSRTEGKSAEMGLIENGLSWRGEGKRERSWPLSARIGAAVGQEPASGRA